MAKPLSGNTCALVNGLCVDKISLLRKQNCSDYDLADCATAKPLSGNTCAFANGLCVDKVTAQPQTKISFALPKFLLSAQVFLMPMIFKSGMIFKTRLL